MIERDGERERQKERGETGERAFDTKKNGSFALVYKIMPVFKIDGFKLSSQSYIGFL